MLTVIAMLSCKNADAATLLSALDNLQKSSRKEVGCLRYELAVKNNDTQTDYIVTEQWATNEHFEEHKLAPHFKTFGEQAGALLTHSNIDVYKTIG
ncbi:putative quinol monooxygenase [uncultured Pseudoalteromonas sp.]|uniref:putative quinol monooxygenase n=1 Tax=uncultured Pseudoalteromonas sp. TaxID=114053 RepID=UPI0030DD9153|tara:strand:+ start:1411 stop:1698 length:288 start_codon:yes stop_codon:yes gene_type:complete